MSMPPFLKFARLRTAISQFGLCIAAVSLTQPSQAAGTAHSLSESSHVLATPEGQRLFDEGMNGTKTDGLGTRLPPGFTKDQILQALAPQTDPRRGFLVGAKPWPQRPGTYVAIACLTTDAQVADMSVTSSSDVCSTWQQDAPVQAWIGVFDRDPRTQAPHLLARTLTPLDVPVDWSDTPIDPPDGMGDTAIPETWKSFDFAPYRLSAHDDAIGLRVGWDVGYAGGGASFEALYLLRMEGDALKVVFARPMAYTRNIAGDWHKDGTRDHDISDGANVLLVLKSATDGMNDLQLRERGGKWRQTFHWSAARQQYLPATPSPSPQTRNTRTSHPGRPGTGN